MHKLDVIVTHYKESAEIVNRFLTSLSNQTFHDLKVTIVDDGIDCPELYLVKMYGQTVNFNTRLPFPFEIEHLKKEHKTVSAARNYGMDSTSAPYLMFCDCDDMFDDRNPAGLEKAMERIVDNDISVYRSKISVEAWKKNLKNQMSCVYKADETDELVLVKSNINLSTVHCKIYKRDFISKLRLRFLDDLWMNEDGAFNTLAIDACKLLYQKNFDDCERFYIWKYNDYSVTRTNKIYPIRGYDQFIIANAYVNRSILSLGMKPENYKFVIATFIFQMYYWLYLYGDRFIGQPEYEECMKSDLKMCKCYLKEFMPIIPSGYFDDLKVVEYRDRLMKSLDKVDMSKKMKFEEWIESLMK